MNKNIDSNLCCVCVCYKAQSQYEITLKEKHGILEYFFFLQIFASDLGFMGHVTLDKELRSLGEFQPFQ
jgi:hypothetical protein